MNMSEEESEYLERFGAHAEAKLAVSAMAMRSHSQEAFAKLLQRRIFMLQSTLWNPKSDAFQAKTRTQSCYCCCEVQMHSIHRTHMLFFRLFHYAVECTDSKKLPQQYEMIQVCKTCYLIYHTIDGERFQASRSTSKAAARLYNAKIMSTSSEGFQTRASPPGHVKTRAWAESEDGDTSA